jgi:hypothetical protein
MQLKVTPSAIVTSYSFMQGSIPFQTIESGENSIVCKSSPEAYVVYTQSEWLNSIAKKIRNDCNSNISDKPLPAIDFNQHTALIYFWGQKPTGGAQFSISKIEGDANTKSVLITINYEDGMLNIVTNPYIVATVPKLSAKEFIFIESTV